MAGAVASVSIVESVFTVAEGRELGVERWHLRSKRRWRRVGPGLYAPARSADGPLLQLAAATLRLPAVAAFGGLTAAWLHGIDVPPCDPVEVIVPKGVGVSSRSGMRVSRARLPAPDVAVVGTLRATTMLRTLEDLGRFLPVVEATVIADMALHAGLVERSAFVQRAHTRSGGRGVANLRRVVGLVEPKAESPMETRLRLVIVLDGLPVPEAQAPIYDEYGHLIARVDLYYPRQRLAIEYDGGVHKDQLVEDNRRQNRIQKAGVRLLRFTAGDVYSQPAVVLAQVRAMLAA